MSLRVSKNARKDVSCFSTDSSDKEHKHFSQSKIQNKTESPLRKAKTLEESN